MSIKDINKLKEKYVGRTNVNNQGCQMTIIDYIRYNDIIIEFNDDYKCKKHCELKAFKNGKVKNPMHPTIYNIGIVGDECPVCINGISVKEFSVWYSILKRCYNKTQHERIKSRSYEQCTVCDEWLYYPNFYRWLHLQENFQKWHDGDKWDIDKDILIKNNYTYSPATCCLVPRYVNSIFIKNKSRRGLYPIGVHYNKKRNVYTASCNTPFLDKEIYLGEFTNKEEAFNAYKICKEKIIKKVAETEYINENITRQCYEAMMNYKVEITD